MRWFSALRAALRLSRGSDSGAGRHLIYFGEACVLARSLERERVQHLHAHFATNATTIALLARLLGGPPFSFTAHGTDAQDHMPLRALGEKVRHARFVIAVSHHARAHLMRFSDPRDWPRIHVVRCGLEDIYLRMPGARLPREPRLLCVARFGEEKGHLVLLEALARLAATGVAFELELVGDGPLRPVIESAIARLELREHVKLSGWLGSAQVRERLLASRVLVLPSLAEGLPVVLMEALAAGRPVVASQVGAIPELVVPGENGWLVPPASVEGLASALRAALASPDEQLERMGAAGHERVLQMHAVDREAQKLAALMSQGADAK